MRSCQDTKDPRSCVLKVVVKSAYGCCDPWSCAAQATFFKVSEHSQGSAEADECTLWNEMLLVAGIGSAKCKFVFNFF